MCDCVALLIVLKHYFTFFQHISVFACVCVLFSCYLGNLGYGSISNAFIFSLRNKEGLGPFKSMVKNSSRAVYLYSGYGPTFGAGWDIHITNYAIYNTDSYTRFGYSYSVPSGVQDRRTILAGTFKFTPDEVEVFYLV